MGNKLKIKSKYAKFGLSIFLAGIGIILCYYLLYNTKNVFGVIRTINDILTPFYLGIIVAYLMSPVYNRTLKYLYRRNRGRFRKEVKTYKFCRFVATVVTLIILFAVCFSFLMLVVPELIDSIIGLIRDVPSMIENTYNWLDKRMVENPEMAKYVHLGLDKISQKAIEWAQNNAAATAETLISGLSMGIIGTFSTAIDIFVAVVIVVYVLNSKEIFQAQVKKFILAVFSKETAGEIFEFGKLCNNTFGGFINGKIIDSIIIGIICFVGMELFNLPLAMLISVIVGFTNVIPFFGPFIGAIPSIILLLFVEPVSALKFAIWVLVLQQLDGNIIGPKILGKTTRLASFWVMFAIIVGGGLFGFAGMILGVPTMAIIYVYLARTINSKLEKKNLPSDTMVYENFDKYGIDKEVIFGRHEFTFNDEDKGTDSQG